MIGVILLLAGIAFVGLFASLTLSKSGERSSQALTAHAVCCSCIGILAIVAMYGFRVTP